MNYDDLLDEIGGVGIYHIILFFVLSYPSFQLGMDLQMTMLSIYTPKFNCSLSNDTTIEMAANVSITDNQCSYRVNNSAPMPCNQWVYDKSEVHKTLVTEFDLVCDKQFIGPTFLTARMLGAICGLPLSYLGDRVGRRITIFVFMVLEVCSSIVVAFSPGLINQFIFRFLVGCSSGLIRLCFVLLTEFTPVSRRSLFGANFWLLWCFGYMAAPLLVYLDPHWRHSKMYTFPLYVFYIAAFFVVKESPRWLILNGRKEEAFDILRWIAGKNRKTVKSEIFDNAVCHEDPTGNVKELCQYPHMRLKTFACLLLSWTYNCSYFGIAADPKFASDNIFIGVFLMGLIEVPTGPAAGFLTQKFGRKRPSLALMMLTCICIICIPFLSLTGPQRWVRLALALLGKFALTAAFDLIDLINTEIFPTTLRNVGLALVSLSGNCGLIVAPFIVRLGEMSVPYLPALVFCAKLILTGVVIMLVLPETRDCPLADIVQDADRLRRGNEREWTEEMRAKAKQEEMELDPMLKENEGVDL